MLAMAQKPCRNRLSTMKTAFVGAGEIATRERTSPNLLRASEHLATDLIFYFAGKATQGIESWKQFATTVLTAFPDVNVWVEEIVAEGDKVVVRWRCRGIHEGDLRGVAPTGKEAMWDGIAIYRLAGGKIAEIRGLE